jgi:hypothetical protein
LFLRKLHLDNFSIRKKDTLVDLSSFRIPKHRKTRYSPPQYIDSFAMLTFWQISTTVVKMTPNTPANEFTLFPKLAPELQIMIWKEALPESNVVTITARWVHRFQADGRRSRPNCAKASYNISAIFRVNRQSRKVATEAYCLSVGEQLSGRSTRPGPL